MHALTARLQRTTIFSISMLDSSKLYLLSENILSKRYTF